MRICLVAMVLFVACSSTGDSGGSGGGGASTSGGCSASSGGGDSSAGGGFVSAGGGLASAGGGSVSTGGGTALGGGSSDAGRDFTRTLPSHPNRSYDVHLPPSYDGGASLPVVLLLHGGGGSRAIQEKTVCPNGDLLDPGCFNALSDPRGYITVYPDGTPLTPSSNIRTWNGGGGDGGWQCISSFACNQNVDDVGYFTQLLADLHTAVSFDSSHVFVTGFSNGAAMTEALGCALPGVSAIAVVAGGTQWATTRPCPGTPSVLEFHGTADPCWNYDGGPASCADNNPGVKLSVDATMAGWVARDGCDPNPTTTALPDSANDGTTVSKIAYSCSQGRDLQLYRIEGGGHTWPNGSQAPGATTGVICKDISANQVMLDFFDAHR